MIAAKHHFFFSFLFFSFIMSGVSICCRCGANAFQHSLWLLQHVRLRHELCWFTCTCSLSFRNKILPTGFVMFYEVVIFCDIMIFCDVLLH